MKRIWSFEYSEPHAEVYGSVDKITRNESQEMWDGDEPWEDYFGAENQKEFYLTGNSGQLLDLESAVLFEMEALLDQIKGPQEKQLRKLYKDLRRDCEAIDDRAEAEKKELLLKRLSSSGKLQSELKSKAARAGK